MSAVPPPPPIYVGVDSETALIQAGNLAPPLVCVTWAQRVPGGGIMSDLLLRDEGIAFWRRALLAPEVHLAIHNAPFDLGVAANEASDLLPLIFAAYDAGRIHCTIVLQKLIDVALGMRKFRRWQRGGQPVVDRAKYGLDDLVEYYFGERVDKGGDTWRRSYALLQGVPRESWPRAAVDYALRDAVLHLRLLEAEEAEIRERWGELPDQVPQQRAAFALHLMSMWGVRADAAAVERFVEHCDVEIAKMQRDLAGTGIFRDAYRCGGGTKCPHTAPDPWVHCPRCGASKCRRNPEAGARSMAEIRARVVASCERRGVAVPMTPPSPSFPGGQVGTDKEVLESTDDVALHVLASQMTFAKHKSQWQPVCEAAVLRPVVCSYDSLMETGRTSAHASHGQEGSNIQNPPRQGDVRACFVPRHRWLYAFSDADTIELRALAQCCLEIVGWSRMAEALHDQYYNGGPDLHVRLAANIEGITFQEAHELHKSGDVKFKTARQLGKHANFGLGGGMGAETFVALARGFGIRLADTLDEEVLRAGRLREIWFETWPEMRQYFKVVGKMIDDSTGEGTIRQLMSGRIRGGVRFTAAANGFFQGRVADAEKEILWNLAVECYEGRCTSRHVHGGSALCTHAGRSVLMGSRPVMFLHDENSLEHPEDGTEGDRAERQKQVNEEGLNKWMSQVPCTAGCVLVRRWYKGAEAVRVGGKLVPSRPVKVVEGDKEKIKWVADLREEKVVWKAA